VIRLNTEKLCMSFFIYSRDGQRLQVLILEVLNLQVLNLGEFMLQSHLMIDVANIKQSITRVLLRKYSVILL